MARRMGCSVGELTYLGLPIGVCMRREVACRPAIEKFKKRLADGKAKAMYFGGRLTLVKYVLGSLPLYYFSLFRVPSCVLKNLKRVRRVEGGALWVRVLKSIYGLEGVLGEFVRAGDGVGGVWGDIVRVGRDIDKLGIEFSSSFVRKVGDGSCISFWGERWVDGVRLMDRFLRLFHLDRCKESVVADKGRWDEGTWR
ncbi:hypothetical protein Tco_1349785 [Tanacetum coccineum]